jgi:hypothetical protein
LPWGGLLVAAACFCWSIYNNLTRKVSASSPVQIAAIKGAVAGVVNIGIGLTIYRSSTSPTAAIRSRSFCRSGIDR